MEENMDLVTKDMKRTEALSVLSALDFTDKICLQKYQAPATTGKVWSNEESFLAEKEQVREHLNWLDVHKSIRSYGMHSQVLRKLTQVPMRPILIIFVRLSWTKKVPEEQKAVNVNFTFNYLFLILWGWSNTNIAEWFQVPILWDIENLTTHGPEQPALDDSALSTGLD